MAAFLSTQQTGVAASETHRLAHNAFLIGKKINEQRVSLSLSLSLSLSFPPLVAVPFWQNKESKQKTLRSWGKRSQIVRDLSSFTSWWQYNCAPTVFLVLSPLRAMILRLWGSEDLGVLNPSLLRINLWPSEVFFSANTKTASTMFLCWLEGIKYPPPNQVWSLTALGILSEVSNDDCSSHPAGKNPMCWLLLVQPNHWTALHTIAKHRLGIPLQLPSPGIHQGLVLPAEIITDFTVLLFCSVPSMKSNSTNSTRTTTSHLRVDHKGKKSEKFPSHKQRTIDCLWSSVKGSKIPRFAQYRIQHDCVSQGARQQDQKQLPGRPCKAMTPWGPPETLLNGQTFHMQVWRHCHQIRTRILSLS